MTISELLSLVSNASEGKYQIEKGTIGSNGYGFVFRDPLHSNDPFIFNKRSSKFGTVSLIMKRNFLLWWDPKEVSRGDLYNHLVNEDKFYILLAGSLKTLVPTLKFGGDEILFESWMFVKTPDLKQFPATFYYGPSGMALGGWRSIRDDSGRNIFPKEFASIISFNPFSFSKDELKSLIEALEHALRKVPVSDFYGVYKHDLGQTLMGIRFKKPFSMELYRLMNEEEVRNIVNGLIL